MGEPIWATAQNSGLNSAVLMWPGPPITSAGVRARYFQKYESGWDLDRRLGRVLEWLDVKDVEKRASLICAYVPDIDQAAHRFGPESKEAYSAVKRVDEFIGKLHREVMEKRRLGDIVDIVVVSDHGMTTTNNHKLIYLDALLGEELYQRLDHRDAWPLAGLRFKGDTPSEREKYTRQAYDKLSKVTGREREGWDLYRREDLPERYRLNSQLVKDRLADVWMIPKLGWSITTGTEMKSFTDGVYGPVGNHGYDNEELEMHAIFVASGPSFKPREKGEGVKKGKANMKGFRNVEVHNLVSRILGVPESKRAHTNGSWGFWDEQLRPGL